MAELYKFVDNGVYHTFSPTLFSKTFEGRTYSPTIVTRSALNLTDNFAKSPVTFKFDRTHSYAKELLVNMPETPVVVSIIRNNLLYWSGRVLEVKANTLTIEVKCDSIHSTILRSGLQPRITMNCRHVLYSQNCGVVQSIWGSPYVVAGLNSSAITVPGLSEETGYFDGGVAQINNQKRFIVTQVGNLVTIAYPFTNSQTGTLILYPGCKLTEKACKGFNNLPNFGGFSRIPDQNPFSSTGAL